MRIEKTVKRYLAIDDDSSAYLYDQKPKRDGSFYNPGEGNYDDADELWEELKSKGFSISTDDGPVEVLITTVMEIGQTESKQTVPEKADDSIMQKVTELEKRVEALENKEKFY